MQVFRCDRCSNPLYFENVTCLQCGSALAFLPDHLALCAIELATGEGPGLWRRIPGPAGAAAGRYHLCLHHDATQSCNFAVPCDDPNPLCVSCRQTRTLPDLSVAPNRQRWVRLESAKRRLFFTLARLNLLSGAPPPGSSQGPVFEFLADRPGQPVLTGHRGGVITVNIAEADDDERERRRLALNEPYRTLLGHLRHESGHYYWGRLVGDTTRLLPFRSAFGDERADYAQALQAHHAQSEPGSGWQQAYVSAYAAAHPWEDWAETWAHYLHMLDLLETGASFAARVPPPGHPLTQAAALDDPFARHAADFSTLVAQWIPLTLLVNSLNRSLGQGDAYPFALGLGALEKLRFVHETLGLREAARGRSA